MPTMGLSSAVTLRDGAGDVVLEEGLAAGVEEGDGLLPVERLDGEAEVDLVGEVEGLGPDVVEVGGVLGVGVGLGVELLQRDPALGRLLELEEEVLDVAGVVLERAGDGAAVLGDVVADGHGQVLGDLLKDVPGAVAEGVDVVLGEIDAEVEDPQSADDVVHDDGDEDDDGDGDEGDEGRAGRLAGGGAGLGFGVAHGGWKRLRMRVAGCGISDEAGATEH